MGCPGVCRDVDQGGSNQYTVVESSLQDGVLSVHVGRPLLSSDLLDLNITSGAVPILWAYGSNHQLTYHGAPPCASLPLFMPTFLFLPLISLLFAPFSPFTLRTTAARGSSWVDFLGHAAEGTSSAEVLRLLFSQIVFAVIEFLTFIVITIT
jgi:hypothetical protein